MAIPGIEAGRTWRRIVCHCVAPSASEPSRIEGGTARIASRAAMITVGKTSRARVREPAATTKPRSSGPADDEGEPEDAVDDRWDRREVLDVELDQPVPPALAVRVLLQVDRGADTERDDQQDHPEDQIEAADDRWPEARAPPD